MADRSAPQTIDDYAAALPPDVRKVLERIRQTIRKAAPRAAEKISYKMPAFVQDGVLVYVGAFKTHIGLYPPVRGDGRLDKELARYRGEKANLKFPLDEPIPYGLIAKVVKFRVKEQAQRARSRRKNK